MFVLEYRRDEARRTTFGSLFGAMRSRQGSHCHVATSPRRDVTKSRRGGQLIQKSTIHHVATSPRRDVTTWRRQLKNLHLIIKCEGARDSRVSKNVRLEEEIAEPATLTSRIFLDFCIGFSLLF